MERSRVNHHPEPLPKGNTGVKRRSRNSCSARHKTEIKWWVSGFRGDPRNLPFRHLLLLRVTHCDQDHLISLNSGEAALLVDACALLLLAAQTMPQCQLKPEMAAVLTTVFEQFSGHTV
jgi:hypothetical protein